MTKTKKGLGKPKPGRVLEMLVARIEQAISDLDVKVTSPDYLPDKDTGILREVDASLRSTIGSAAVLVIVECRDRGRPADLTWLEQVKSKRDAVSASKAIAVASGDFSKAALRKAAAYDIDARTIAQLKPGDIRIWAGTLEIFQQEARYDSVRVTVRVAGTESVPEEVLIRFNELVRGHAFEAKFIGYLEGLLSPLDVVRKFHPLPALPKSRPVKITIPPKSAFILSQNPAMTLLSEPLDVQASGERSRTLNFAEGEAQFVIDGFARPLVAVQLDFNIFWGDKTPMQPESFRYESSTGLIEIAEFVTGVGDNRMFITQHRRTSH